MYELSKISERRCGVAHAWRIVEAKSNGASNAAFAGTIGTNDHVKVWPRAKLGVVVGDKVVQFDAYNRSGDIPMA